MAKTINVINMMKKPTLYILSGFPYSGKSTLAKELVKSLGLSLVSTDSINTEQGIGLQGEAISPQQWDNTYHLVYKRIEELLSRGESVIYDDCNFTKKQRDLTRK